MSNWDELRLSEAENALQTELRCLEEAGKMSCRDSKGGSPGKTGGCDKASCRHCTDDKILMAVCTSDFVVRGSVQAIKNGDGGDEDDDEDHALLMVSSSHVYRQKKRVFVPAGGGTRGRGRWTGRVKVLQKCSLGAEQREEFLLTGSVRFGEAWLGCALQYKDFLHIYHSAMRAGSNPCHIDTD